MSDPNDFDFDVLVVGGGPAGLSASLVLGRTRRRVLLVDAGQGRNAPAVASHGFFTRDGAPPSELREVGREQLAPYDVTIWGGSVARLRRVRGGFSVEFEGDPAVSRSARRVVLATGMRDHLPAFDGFTEIYGRSAHHCPYCDAWEWRDRAVAVYAPPDGTEYALSLSHWTADVVLLTNNGRALSRAAHDRLERNGVRVETSPIESLESDRGMLTGVRFRHGGVLPRDAFFFHLGMSQASPLPVSAGCALDRDGFVRVNGAGMTSVPGIYAAGDLTPGPQSVVMAAAEGAQVAASIHQELRARETA